MSQIHWLVCKTSPAAEAAEPTEVPTSDLEVAAESCLDGEAGPSLRLLSFLSPAERQTLATWRFPKRRREWLLGRWTAKHLLRHAQPQYADLPLTAITVANDPDGAPYLSVAGKGRLPLSLSISHRNNYAFCALLAPTPTTASLAHAPGQTIVGADLEEVYPRDPAFVRDYFTAAEAERVWHCPDDLRDTLVTVLWSAKEAVLKVLRLGLTVDTRRVELRYVAGIEPSTNPVALPFRCQWYNIQVDCTLPNTPSLCAWWRPQANHVLTLAAFAHPEAPPHPRATPVQTDGRSASQKCQKP